MSERRKAALAALGEYYALSYPAETRAIREALEEQDAEVAQLREENERLRGLLTSLNSWAENFDCDDPEFTDIVDEVERVLSEGGAR